MCWCPECFNASAIKEVKLVMTSSLFSLSSVPIKRILNKPQIVRSLGSNLHPDVNASHSRAGWSLLSKVQRSRHKNLYEVNHQNRVRMCLVLGFMRRKGLCRATVRDLWTIKLVYILIHYICFAPPPPPGCFLFFFFLFFKKFFIIIFSHSPPRRFSCYCFYLIESMF